MENVENKTEEKEIEPYDFDYWQDYFLAKEFGYSIK